MAKNSNNRETLKKMARMAELIQDQELLNKIGLAYTTMVRRRTQQEGRDIHGTEFAPYAKSYIPRKKKEGMSAHPVNMTLDKISGMMTKLDHVVFNDLDGVKAYINNAQKAQIGKWQQTGAGNLPVREWWGLTDQQIEKIRTTIAKNLDKIFETEL